MHSRPDLISWVSREWLAGGLALSSTPHDVTSSSLMSLVSNQQSPRCLAIQVSTGVFIRI